MTSHPQFRTKVFISYSHKDIKWVERFQVHLKPLEREGIVERWDDTMLKPGSEWREEIKNAIEAAKVAVLFISADFLASEFIVKNELPPLLAAADRGGAVIIPVIIGHSRFEQTTNLSRFQTLRDNPPSKPLGTMTKANQEKVLVRLTEAIERALNSQPNTISPLQEVQVTVVNQDPEQRLKSTEDPIIPSVRPWDIEGGSPLEDQYRKGKVRDVTGKVGANIVCLGAKTAMIVTENWTFGELEEHPQLENHAFTAAIIEFENQPVLGRKIDSVEAVEAQILFYDAEAKERHRIEGGAWVGEHTGLTIFNVGHRRKLVIAFGKCNGEEVEVWIAQNNRRAFDSNIKPTYRKLAEKWLRVYVRLVSNGEVIIEENLELSITSLTDHSGWLTIKTIDKDVLKLANQPVTSNQQSIRTGGTVSSKDRGWFYYCYISEAKVDQILAQAQDDIRESIEETATKFRQAKGNLSSIINNIFEAGVEYGRPKTLRFSEVRSKVLITKLYAAMHALERKWGNIPSLTEKMEKPDGVLPGIYLYFGEFRVSKYDEEFAYLESILTPRITLKLSCSLRYFSDVWDENRNFIPHSGNVMFFSGEFSPSFQSILYVLQVKNGLVLATPLFLGLPLNSPLQL
jgi:hypothetical protein